MSQNAARLNRTDSKRPARDDERLVKRREERAQTISRRAVRKALREMLDGQP